MESRITFYDWKPSPFCFKVRAVLDHKGIAYRRIDPLGAPAFKIRCRGKIGKVPAVEFGDEMIVDSTNIVYELERRFPSNPVIPVSALERARCHTLEDWADESLYFSGLYYQWIEPEGKSAVPRAFGKGLTGRFAYQYYSRLITRQLKGQGTLRKPAAHIRSDLIRHLDAIEAMLESQEYLLGTRPYLCDFALLGQLVYLARTPVGGRLLEGRGAIRNFRERMKGHSRAAASAASSAG